ncbi:DUF4412 domain-containing protein [Puia dinghuensis]|uniref:DUF4412 domain-containing protein n=1 Tax=Puia dinghuensis TaxID=1792502 RepID=A0A8J2XT40_9BACT|nr:DUF4412 domain-containing protein [Puia dinghuensis]GGB00307.1 hypothetical protein GCM10011511_24510 [Puia dinghuensis]
MKKLTILAFFLGIWTIGQAQFEGILTYDCTIKNKTLTTVYESKTKVLLEAKIYPMKGGVADIKEAKEQDPILFDFEAKKATRFGSRHHETVSTDLAPVTADRTGKLKDEDITIEMVGTEKIEGYSCQHFIVKIKGNPKELWITKDLGVSSVCMLSQFDYYPAGSLLYDKLKSAGGDGIVVRSKSGDVIVNLSNAQVKTVPPSYFEIPGKS